MSGRLIVLSKEPGRADSSSAAKKRKKKRRRDPGIEGLRQEQRVARKEECVKSRALVVVRKNDNDDDAVEGQKDFKAPPKHMNLFEEDEEAIGLDVTTKRSQAPTTSIIDKSVLPARDHRPFYLRPREELQKFEDDTRVGQLSEKERKKLERMDPMMTTKPNDLEEQDDDEEESDCFSESSSSSSRRRRRRRRKRQNVEEEDCRRHRKRRKRRKEEKRKERRDSRKKRRNK